MLYGWLGSVSRRLAAGEDGVAGNCKGNDTDEEEKAKGPHPVLEPVGSDAEGAEDRETCTPDAPGLSLPAPQAEAVAPTEGGFGQRLLEDGSRGPFPPKQDGEDAEEVPVEPELPAKARRSFQLQESLFIAVCVLVGICLAGYFWPSMVIALLTLLMTAISVN